MKLANNVRVRVFCREDEDRGMIARKLRQLLPFDPEKEKVAIEERKAEGFNEKTILIMTAALSKDRHVNPFLKNLADKLGDEAATIAEQADSRTDENMNLFIRLDKEMLLKDRFVLTDAGNCYHVRINLAAYPKKKEKAYPIINKIFNRKQ